MKTLELTVYPLRDKVGRNARPGFIVGKRAVSVAEAHRLMTAKRFTDAELAAEGYREMALGFESLANALQSKAQADLLGKAIHEGNVTEHRRRGKILHRFATRPHYDEAAS